MGARAHLLGAFAVVAVLNRHPGTFPMTHGWWSLSGIGGKGSAVTYWGSASTNEGSLSVPQRLYSSVMERGASGEDAWASAAELDLPSPVAFQPTSLLCPDFLDDGRLFGTDAAHIH